jgi:hypothetical protein
MTSDLGPNQNLFSSWSFSTILCVHLCNSALSHNQVSVITASCPYPTERDSPGAVHQQKQELGQEALWTVMKHRCVVISHLWPLISLNTELSMLLRGSGMEEILKIHQWFKASVDPLASLASNFSSTMFPRTSKGWMGLIRVDSQMSKE